MKKFLFTLASLFVAVSSFGAAEGDNYAYIEDFELTADMLGNNNVRRNVKVHLDNYVSAWQVNFTYPVGITCRGFVKGTDLTLTYLDELGDQQTITPALNKNSDNTRCIVAQTEAAYDADGNYLGAAQWAPGDYDQMWIVVLNIAADFAGGDITMVSGMSSSGWMDNSNVPYPNQTYTTVCHITQPGGNTEALTADITIGEADGLFVPITVTNVNDADAVITVTVGGEPATIVDGGVTLPAWNTDYEIVVTVTAAGEGYEGVVTKTETRNAGEQPKTADPVITATWEYGQLTVTAEGDGDVHLYINRGEVENPYVTTYDIYEGYGPVTFYATAQEPGKAMGEATKVVEIPAEERPTVQTPLITYTYENGVVTVTATCATTGATIHLAIDGVAVSNPYTESYDIYEGYEAEATAYATYPEWNNSATATTPIVIAPVQYQTGVPTVQVTEGEDGWTFTATGEENANVVLYVTTYDPETGAPTTNTYTNPAEVYIPKTTADQVVGYYAVATSTLYDDALPGISQSATVIIPAKQGGEQPQCHAPNGAYTITGFETATVTLTNNEPGATVYYDVYFNGELVPELSGSFTGDSFSFTVTGDGRYDVVAVAKKEGYKDSTEGGVWFIIQENEVPTGINEVVDGKQIANVRYFNMAGQEMQEVNGMTIVVTTYTDGTTSSAKVMK